MKPIVAHKHPGLQDNYDSWIPLNDNKFIIYGIDNLGPVITTSGPMVKVKLRQKVEMANINQDVAALVGKLPMPMGHHKPDLYFWDDQYWLMGLDSNTEWYKNQCYLLYPINVTVTDEYIANQSAIRDRKAAAKQP